MYKYIFSLPSLMQINMHKVFWSRVNHTQSNLDMLFSTMWVIFLTMLDFTIISYFKYWNLTWKGQNPFTAVIREVYEETYLLYTKYTKKNLLQILKMLCANLCTNTSLVVNACRDTTSIIHFCCSRPSDSICQKLWKNWVSRMTLTPSIHLS